MASPTLDSVVGATFFTASSKTVTFSTAGTNRIVLVVVGVETISPTATPTVNTPTATGLTFQLRKDSGNLSPIGSTGGTEEGRIVSFWALASAQQTNTVITVTTSANVDDAAIVVSTWAGCNTTSPFDPNASLPKTALHTSNTSFTDTVSTTNADDVIVQFVIDGDSASTYTKPTAFTTLLAQQTQAGGTGAIQMACWFESFSAAQTNLSIAYTNSNSVPPIAYEDALTADTTASNPFFETDWPNPVIPIRSALSWTYSQQLTNNQILMSQALL